MPANNSSSASTSTSSATTHSDTCQCGERGAKVCRSCDLVYCAPCCTKRHAKGAFVRHTVADVVVPRTDAMALHAPPASPSSRAAAAAPSVCDECLDAPAALRCSACELCYCSRCATHVHAVGTLQRHVERGDFVALDGSLAASAVRDALGLKSTLIRAGEATEAVEDPDAEAAPGSPPVAKDTTATDDAESYDLWSSWSVRSFSERSASIESATQWRNLRSLSIDSKASTVASDDVPLASLSQSLQSLAFPPAVAPAVAPSQDPHTTSARASPDLYARRPRSFSDYTSLRSHSADMWLQQSSAPLPSADAPSTTRHSDAAASAYTGALELWTAMKTNFPSRHVLVKSATGPFSPNDVERIRERLYTYGSVATLRDDFASDGLLFATYCALKCAIGAVTTWTSAHHRPHALAEALHFCLPYEAPDDVNCATLLVRLLGSPVSSTEMRQFCSRYGEVASVLQNDSSSSKYIVEYNDVRDVASALAGLAAAAPSSSHPNGAITAVRTSPPTLNMAKLQLFQDHLERATAARMARLELRSSSTASPLLAVSPTSTASASSPLTASFLETTASSSAAATSATDGVESVGPPTGVGPTTSSRASSPFDSSSSSSFQMRTTSPSLSDDPIWARPAASALRPRSSSSSLIGIRSTAPSLAPPPAPGVSAFSDFAPFANPYSSALAAAAASVSDTFPPYMPSQQQQHHTSHFYHHQQSQPHHHHTQQQQQQRKYSAPARSGSDPAARSSAGSTSGTSHHAVIGRNDQGTGEFSLSLERVASGADTRTTLMIRNIPNKYTQQMLLSEINERHRGAYDFFYLPIDFKNKCNMGYAFLNFIDAATIVSFVEAFDAQKWRNFNSEKVCAISYARLQGKQAMIARFQNSSLLDKHESYRPLVFASSGPNRGQPEPFPAPKMQSHYHHHHHNNSHNSHNHHSRKHAMHPHHHFAMGGSGHGHSANASDDFGSNASAPSRMYLPSHQQQQQMQALHHAHQLMAASQLAHTGLHGFALPQGAASLHHMPSGYPLHFQPPPPQGFHPSLQPLEPRHVSAQASTHSSAAAKATMFSNNSHHHHAPPHAASYSP